MKTKPANGQAQDCGSQHPVYGDRNISELSFLLIEPATQTTHEIASPGSPVKFLSLRKILQPLLALPFCFHPCFKTFFLNFNLVLKLHPFPFFPFSVKVKVAQLCPTLCNPMDYFSPWNSLDQNTGVGSLSLLQGIFPNPGIKPRSPALQADSLPAEPQGKPFRMDNVIILELHTLGRKSVSWIIFPVLSCAA